MVQYEKDDWIILSKLNENLGLNNNLLAADYKESFDKPSCASCKNISLSILINVKGVYKIDNKGPTVYTIKNTKICHKKNPNIRE